MISELSVRKSKINTTKLPYCCRSFHPDYSTSRSSFKTFCELTSSEERARLLQFLANRWHSVTLDSSQSLHPVIPCDTAITLSVSFPAKFSSSFSSSISHGKKVHLVHSSAFRFSSATRHFLPCYCTLLNLTFYEF